MSHQYVHYDDQRYHHEWSRHKAEEMSVLQQRRLAGGKGQLNESLGYEYSPRLSPTSTTMLHDEISGDLGIRMGLKEQKNVGRQIDNIGYEYYATTIQNSTGYPESYGVRDSNPISNRGRSSGAFQSHHGHHGHHGDQYQPRRSGNPYDELSRGQEDFVNHSYNQRHDFQPGNSYENNSREGQYHTADPRVRRMHHQSHLPQRNEDYNGNANHHHEWNVASHEQHRGFEGNIPENEFILDHYGQETVTSNRDSNHRYERTTNGNEYYPYGRESRHGGERQVYETGPATRLYDSNQTTNDRHVFHRDLVRTPYNDPIDTGLTMMSKLRIHDDMTNTSLNGSMHEQNNYKVCRRSSNQKESVGNVNGSLPTPEDIRKAPPTPSRQSKTKVSVTKRTDSGAQPVKKTSGSQSSRDKFGNANSSKEYYAPHVQQVYHEDGIDTLKSLKKDLDIYDNRRESRDTPQQQQQPSNGRGIQKTDHVAKLEIAPGVYSRLRGAQETMACIQNDFYMPNECLSCEQTIFCIQDAGFILCPYCHSIGPNNNGSCTNFEDNKNSIEAGVGLGFTIEELATWQMQAAQQQQQYR